MDQSPFVEVSHILFVHRHQMREEREALLHQSLALLQVRRDGDRLIVVAQ